MLNSFAMEPRGPAEFCIQIDFLRQSESPARVFRAMTGLIEAFQDLDKQLVRSFDIKIEPVLILEDIEAGSIKAWLRTQLTEHDDKDLKNLNWKPAVGKYLVKAKYILIDFLTDKTEISDRTQLQTLQQKMLTAAEETNANAIPAYAPLTLPEVVNSINAVSTALVPLKAGDSAKYLTGDTQTDFNLLLAFSPESMERLLTKETISNQAVMILKVKRPDYLGEAMWDLRHESKQIEAKILDSEWLANFQSRKIDVRPGDALRATVRIDVEYGYDGEVVATHYSVLSVSEVVPAEEPRQTQLLERPTNENR